MRTQLKLISYLLVLLTVQGCGGGGANSTSASTQSTSEDGLGTEGLLPGAVVLGKATIDGQLNAYGSLFAAVVLRDDDSALAVWRIYDNVNPSGNKIVWSAQDTAGNWNGQQTLPQIDTALNYLPIVLRGNAQGDAVLGWGTTAEYGSVQTQWAQLLRFRQKTGWDASPISYTGGQLGRYGTIPTTWDLTLLNDLSVVMQASSQTAEVGILRTDANNQQTLQKTTPTTSQVAFAPFGYSADTGGMSFFVDASNNATNGSEVRARLTYPSANMAFNSLPALNTAMLCATNDFGTMMVAGGGLSSSVAAVIVADPAFGGNSCLHKQMVLVRVDALASFRVSKLGATTAGKQLSAPPVLAVDQQGRALAAWCEGVFDTMGQGHADQCRWSQSLPNGDWSTPQDLVSNLATLGRIDHLTSLSLAMNSQGEAVAALIINGGGIDKFYNPMLITSRFKFQVGWQLWTKVANKRRLTTPAVAINSQGHARVVFSAMDVPRVNGEVSTAIPYINYQPPPLKTYAINF
jgi:hypothetical protein